MIERRFEKWKGTVLRTGINSGRIVNIPEEFVKEHDSMVDEIARHLESEKMSKQNKDTTIINISNEYMNLLKEKDAEIARLERDFYTSQGVVNQQRVEIVALKERIENVVAYIEEHEPISKENHIENILKLLGDDEHENN